jgi:hypothetical protein
MKYKLQPYVLSLRITERCNVGCPHCSLSAKPTGRDMPIDLANEAIRKASSFGIGLLHISGGEPLLHPELPKIVAEGRAAGMVVEMVTSTFTYACNEKHELDLLRQLAESGLNTILLSYDDGHAKCVSLDKFLRFTRKAMDLGLEICIFCIDSPYMLISADKMVKVFSSNGLDTTHLEWARGMYSGVGRGKNRLYEEDHERKILFNRCPYVMPVPTLTPEGKFLLCPCSILSSKYFILGDYYTDGMLKVLCNFECSPIYKMLGKYGPHLSLLKCGVMENDLPVEICDACKKYLDLIATKSEAERVEIFKNQNLNDAFIDFEALLPPHKRYLRNYVRL